MTLFDEVRKDPRLAGPILVRWTIEAQQLVGDGMLLDVSVRGARLRLMTPFNGKGGATFTLEAQGVPSLPKRARLRWYRRMPGRAAHYQCGLVFFEQGPEQKRWRDWIAAEFQRLSAEGSGVDRRAGT